MSDRSRFVVGLLEEGLARVDLALERHGRGEPEDLSVGILTSVRRDLQKMQVALDPATYCSAYPRFVLDWPNEHGLIDLLVHVHAEYDKLK
ncbi:MAG: hypothetical protein AAF533_27975 [Acidobacteriota bacterium]